MKKLIKFYKKNKAISNIGFIAWVIALSYAITYNMPDYFGIESYYSLANNMFFASTFWQKLQSIFGECCISKLEKFAKPWLTVFLPAT